MKAKSKVPLYQINLEIKSTGGGDFKNNESSILDQGSKSSSRGRHDEEESKQQRSVPQSEAGQSKVAKNEGGVPLVAIEIQSAEIRKSDQKDQDTDPKQGANRSDHIDDNGSNFSLDSIPSENDKNDDQKDQKLRGHTTGRMPVRNIVAARGSGLSNCKWTHHSQVTNSSNYMYTMECYNDSEDMELVNPIVDQVSHTNQVMFTEGFPTTEFSGTRANSLIEMKGKRDSFQQQTTHQQQHTYLKGSHIRNPREYLVKKSQINLISQQDNQVIHNNRSQKYPTMFKYLCNLNKNQNQSALVSDKKPKHLKAKNSGSTIQPNKNSSPSRGQTLGSYQKSNRRKAGQMISQITLCDDETQKVVTDDEQDQGAGAPPFSKAKTIQSKQSDRMLSQSMGLHGHDTSYRASDTKQANDPISVRISKIQSSETYIKEKTVGTDQLRPSIPKEEDALNDTIDEIGTLNKSDKPKTHRSKYSSEFQKSGIKMQPSQIIKKSNIVNKTPVMILKIDLQKKPQAVPAMPKGADHSLSSSQSPLRKQMKEKPSYKTKHESLRISTEVMAQTEKKQAKHTGKDHDPSSQGVLKHKLNRQNSAGKRLQQAEKVEVARSKQVDETYQLDFDKNAKCGTAQGLKKISSKENLKINIQKYSRAAQFEKTGTVSERKDALKGSEAQIQSDLNSFKNKKKSEGLQYTEKRETRVYEKKCLFPTSGLHQSDKKIRQNNSCQNIHNHSSYLQDNKIIQDVQKIKKINLHSSRHQQVEKSSLERIVGSNECLKLFDTIEKIKKTPNLHVKNLSLRKHSEPINSHTKAFRQKANTARQNTQAFHVDEGGLRLAGGSSQQQINNDYVQIEERGAAQRTSNLQHLNLANASHLEQFRKKSQSPCLIQKTQKNLFILSSEDISRPQPQVLSSIRTYPRNRKQNTAEQVVRNNAQLPNRVASAQLCHQDLKDQPAVAASAGLGATASKGKRAKNPRINSQLSHNQDRQATGKESDRGPSQRKDSEPPTSLEKRAGERTQSLKQFIIKQKKELHKARKQNSSWLDEDDIRAAVDNRLVIRTEREGVQLWNAAENMDDGTEERDVTQQSSQQLSQSQNIKLPKTLSPSKKASAKKNSEFKAKSPKKKVKNSSSKKQSPHMEGSSRSKKETPSKRVVQIDLYSQIPLKQSSRNILNESRQIKVSQTSTFTQQRPALDEMHQMSQDLLPIGKEDKLSKASSVSNMHEDKKHKELLEQTAGNIYIDEQQQNAESQDEDPIDPMNPETNRESETEYGASTGQIDMTGRHSDIERQVHQKIRQILKEYRNAINKQEKEKLSLLLKSSADLIQAEVSDLPTEDLRKLNMLSQGSLDDTDSFFTSMNKKAGHQSNNTGESRSLRQQQLQSSTHAKKKERQTWRKKAVSPEPASHGQSDPVFKRSSLKERDTAKMSKARNNNRDDEQIIDLRNQIQLSEYKRKSVASNRAFILPNKQQTFGREDLHEYQEENEQQKDGQSTVEFFLTNSGFGTGAGSNFFLKPSMVDENNRETLLKSDEFSALSVKSPASQVGQQQLMSLRQQLDRESVRAGDGADEGNLENNNDSFIPQKNLQQIESIKKPTHVSRGERALKKRRKKDREAKQSSRSGAEALGATVKSPQSQHQQQQQYGYFINPNDGQISLVPISQIRPQFLSTSQQNDTERLYTQQIQSNEPSVAQTKQLDLSNLAPQGHVQLGMPAVQPQFYLPSHQQQHQVVWMPVPIAQMAHYSHNSSAGSAHIGGGGLSTSALHQSQQMLPQSAALSSLGQLQVPVNISGAPLLNQNGLQVQPFVTGPQPSTPTTGTVLGTGQQGIPQPLLGAPQSPLGANVPLSRPNAFASPPLDAHQVPQHLPHPQQAIPVLLSSRQLQQLTSHLQHSQHLSDSSARNAAAAHHNSNSHSDQNH